MNAHPAVAERAAQNDEQLMAAVKTGCVVAFDVLYGRYRHRAHRIARSVCRDEGRAQEAVQEAFMSIWRTRVNYEDRRSVAPWLLTIARNRAIDVARRNQPHAMHRAVKEHLERVAAAGIIDEQVVATERAQDLLGALAQLPEVQRDVIILAFYAQLTHTEIAERLELPLGTVKGRIRLALRGLRGEVANVNA
jgi:RNA polymerase sigma-70 factor, ECF subfamily